MTTHHTDFPGSPSEALAAVARVAEDWGAEWQRAGDDGGELVLPVVAGLRRGVVSGTVTAIGNETSRITFEETASELRVQRPAVAILLVALGAAVLGMLWPFYPSLIALAPWAAAIVLSAWLLVVARLRSAGAEEFLRAVAHEGQAGRGNP